MSFLHNRFNYYDENSVRYHANIYFKLLFNYFEDDGWCNGIVQAEPDAVHHAVGEREERISPIDAQMR